MARDLKLNLDLSTRDAQRSIQDLTKEVGGLGEEFDDTRSKGKQVADAIRRLSEDAEADMLDARSAVDRLGVALGDDLVAEVKEAGGSVDGLVADLKRLGLTYDDIRADADALGAAIRETRERGKEMGLGLNEGATQASEGLDRVRTSGDQTGSVMANMVGNSVQELASLGGVAGTAGMALGQLGEYATEGNIPLRSLAKFAGPMIGVGVAVAGVSWAVEKLGEDSRKAKEAAEGMVQVLESLRDGDFGGAATQLQEDWGGTIDVLTEMGFTVEEVIGHMTGQSSITEELTGKIDAQKRAMLDSEVARQAYGYEMDDLTENLARATTAFSEQREEMVRTEKQTGAIELALKGAGNQASTTAKQVLEVKSAAERLDAAWSDLKGEIDDRQAFLSLEDTFNDVKAKAEEAWGAASSGAEDAEAKTREHEQAMLSAKEEVIDYLAEVLKLPPERSTRILAALDQGDLEYVEAQLAILTRNRTMSIDIQARGGVGWEVGVGVSRNRASGGPVRAGEPYLVGENPDGSLNSTTELFVPDEDGTIVSAPQTRRLFRGDWARMYSRGAPATSRANSGSAAGVADNTANRFEAGDIDAAAYRAYLNSKLASYEAYSDKWMSVWREINRLTKSESDAIADAAAQQTKALEDAAAEQKRIADDAAREESERVAAAFQHAEAQRALADAVRETEAAWSAMMSNAASDPLDWKFQQAGLDERFARALWNRADANANASGITDGSVGWARAMREMIQADMANANPRVAAQLAHLLAGVPQLAAGGVVRRRPGGTLVNVGEGAHDEMVVPLDGRMAAATYNIVQNFPAGATPRDVTAAQRRYRRTQGPL